MRIRLLGLGSLALSLGLGLSACSSDDTSNATDNAGGTSSTSSGSSGSGGSGGSLGTSGSQGTGGQGGSNGGSGGSSGGSSGAGGSAITDGGGSSDARLTADGSGAVDAGPFALTSSAYTEGMMIPAVYTCAGANTSPPLAWTGAPATTKSFALVFTDKDNNPNAGGFIHWVLWDIPPATMSLPAAIASGMPAGSKGSSFNNNPGYAGPCPGGSLHHYIFELYPLDVASLPNAMNNDDRPTLVTAIKSHQLVPPATLTGTSNAMR